MYVVVRNPNGHGVLRIMCTAIESIRTDGATVVIRTVSGADHRLPCKNDDDAANMIALLLERMALKLPVGEATGPI